MRKLIVFNQVSLDGYFSGPGGDMSWAHRTRDDAEWNSFVGGNATGGGTLLLGRITYQMMASFWPTPQATQMDPVVAKGINQNEKVVFSRTLEEASWTHSRIVKGPLVEEVRKLKNEPGVGLAILGSGSLVAPLAEAGLIDEYQVVVLPVVLGKGRTMFEGLEKRIDLKLMKTRSFANGNVLTCYEPAR